MFVFQFRVNLIKAIDAEREAEGQPPLRQGEFGGVNGGFYQQGGGQGGAGGAGGGGGGGNQEEEDEYEEDEMAPTTPGPGAFGVLSGLFGIFSGLGSLNPSRIIQSTVNFFPPGQRMQAQMIVDSLIGYTPPENRTARPRPRTRRTTVTPTVLPTSEVMTGANNASTVAVSDTMNLNDTGVMSNIGEVSGNATASEGNGTTPMSEVGAVSVVTEATTQAEPEFLNVHELLNRTTIPPPPANEDDEADVEKKFMQRVKPEPTMPSPSSSGPYKIRPKYPDEADSITVDAPPATSASPVSQNK